MKVTSVAPNNGEVVTIENAEWYLYVRYNKDCWYAQMGESYEPIYNDAELEAAYQEFKQTKIEKIL